MPFAGAARLPAIWSPSLASADWVTWACSSPPGWADERRGARPRRARDVTVKIASFNVNGVNGRLPRLLEWLEETRPDVACLQELKTDDSKFPARAIAAAGYGALWHGQRAHHGVAILAR